MIYLKVSYFEILLPQGQEIEYFQYLSKSFSTCSFLFPLLKFYSYFDFPPIIPPFSLKIYSLNCLADPIVMFHLFLFWGMCINRIIQKVFLVHGYFSQNYLLDACIDSIDIDILSSFP